MDARRESVSLFTHTEVLNGSGLPHASRGQSVSLSKLGEKDEEQEAQEEQQEEVEKEEDQEEEEEEERSKG